MSVAVENEVQECDGTMFSSDKKAGNKKKLQPPQTFRVDKKPL
jgi:hypothetical protein